MKTFTAYDYTFTEEELKGENPYLGKDGWPLDGKEFKYLAFKEAAQQYKHSKMPKNERDRENDIIKNLSDKMNS